MNWFQEKGFFFPPRLKTFNFVLGFSQFNYVVVVSGNSEVLSYTYTCIHSPPNTQTGGNKIFSDTDSEGVSPDAASGGQSVRDGVLHDSLATDTNSLAQSSIEGR